MKGSPSSAQWWGATLVIAVIAGGLTQRVTAHRPEQVRRTLVKAELPAGWRSLPITATLTDEVETRHVDDGCGEGYGSIGHEGTLGRFSVSWSNMVYKGLDAGPQGWRAFDARLGRECPALTSALSSSHRPGPQTMREDAVAGVYVLVSQGDAVAACREEVLVTAPAHDATLGERAVASGIVVALVLAASAAARIATGA